MPRGFLQETICHPPGGFSRKEELQEEGLHVCSPSRARRRLNLFAQELPRKGRLRTSALDFFGMKEESDPLQVFNDPIEDFQAPPVGLEQIEVKPRQPYVLEEVQLDRPGRRSVEVPIHSPEEAKAFAANYAVASHLPVDVDLEKNQIVPDDPTQAPDQPDEEVQYWVMEGSDGSGPVVVHHEHHVSHAHHDHDHLGHHHGKDGMSYSEHEETITHTGHGGQHGEGGAMTVRHHIVHRVHDEPPRQRFVPPPKPQDEELKLLDEPQVEPLQPKILLGGLLAIFAQVYLWGNVFVTLFKPNRAVAPPTAATGDARAGGDLRGPEAARQPPLVLYGAGGAVGEVRPLVGAGPELAPTPAGSQDTG
ncbi:unnamed protein product [Durusdinium trenchii]|uniref:Uncharacterized protein n=1 Tax=Durusdinium trenchii TaxID=1381693 RepID=A0ABP0MVV1_9DINO